MVHYESMHPVNPSDVTKTINLVEQYLNGSYQFSHGDLKSILGTDSESEDNLANVDSRDTENLIDETEEGMGILTSNRLKSKLCAKYLAGQKL